MPSRGSDPIEGIYCITCLPTGDKYVGSSRDIWKRWREHLRFLLHGAHTNKPLQYLWDKHGDVFRLDIVEATSRRREIKEAGWANKLEAALTPVRYSQRLDRYIFVNGGIAIKWIPNRDELPPRYVELYRAYEQSRTTSPAASPSSASSVTTCQATSP